LRPLIIIELNKYKVIDSFVYDNVVSLLIKRIFVRQKKYYMQTNSKSFSIQLIEKSSINDVDWVNLAFGNTFSDHMFSMDYENGAWGNGKVMPFQNIPMHPAMSAIHYGQSIFEGLKAYKCKSGKINIFRPELNAMRFAESAKRMCMPEVPESIFLEAIRTLIDLDRNWVPEVDGYSLYIRPFMFATDHLIGIKPSDSYKFMILTSPVGVYYSDSVKVKIEESYTRAAIGGVGRAKAAGNYGASLLPAKQCQLEGFHQLVWTDAIEHKYIEESGTMNIIFQIDGKLISPSEDADTILRGITKRTLIELAKEWGVEVEERRVTVEEIITAVRAGKLEDAFGAGTAATIAQIDIIGFRGEKLQLPPIETRQLSNRIKAYLDDVKYGKTEDIYGWNMTI
jgi:branched-chain amino acid aminotransferase